MTHSRIMCFKTSSSKCVISVVISQSLLNYFNILSWTEFKKIWWNITLLKYIIFIEVKDDIILYLFNNKNNLNTHTLCNFILSSRRSNYAIQRNVITTYRCRETCDNVVWIGVHLYVVFDVILVILFHEINDEASRGAGEVWLVLCSIPRENEMFI